MVSPSHPEASTLANEHGACRIRRCNVHLIPRLGLIPIPRDMCASFVSVELGRRGLENPEDWRGFCEEFIETLSTAAPRVARRSHQIAIESPSPSNDFGHAIP